MLCCSVVLRNIDASSLIKLYIQTRRFYEYYFVHCLDMAFIPPLFVLVLVNNVTSMFSSQHNSLKLKSMTHFIPDTMAEKCVEYEFKITLIQTKLEDQWSC